MRELALLERIRRSPFGGAWLEGARIKLDWGEPWLWSTGGVRPWDGGDADAAITCTASDLDRMLSRHAPDGEVRLSLGDRDLADRVKQARGVLAASALGWLGPWPDPGADEHLDMVRSACLHLAIGPADEWRRLFPSSSARLRLSAGARDRWCTVGLAEAHGMELWTAGDRRWLRAAALHLIERGTLPASVMGVVLSRHDRPLPLPTRAGWLVELRAAP
ncbi:MAG: hypothetical protein FJ090_03940 [Deltaproteobacteria bacterium]|nr:hypothetical protein [Deltaproteobacteria bacterium]